MTPYWGKLFNLMAGTADARDHLPAPRLLVAALSIVLLVAMARMALHAHWPLDVIGGAALGVACGGAAAWWSEAHPPE